MSDQPGLRERKKERTRRAIADTATRLFVERGFEPTTVDSICAEAEVAVSTFYVYFESKEAAAFPDEDARASVVASKLRERARGESLHVTLRRASQAVAERDVDRRESLAERIALLAREPALAAHAARRQAGYGEEFARLIAEQSGADADVDLRPRLVISAVLGALNAAWSAWAADPSRDLRDLVDEAHDILDAGFGKALRNL